MVSSKKLLIVVAILAVSLVPRFFLTEVRTVIPELPVKDLPERVGEWEAVEVLVCPQCHEELKEAVWRRQPPRNPEAKMVYLKGELEGESCPVHHCPLTRTTDVPVPFIVQKVLPPGTLFLRKWYRQKTAQGDAARDVVVTLVTSGADKRSIHRPERCLPAQGWQIVSRDRCAVPLPRGTKRTLNATRLFVHRVQNRIERKEVALYFFKGHDRLTGSNFTRLIWSAWDRIFRGLNYRWSYALLTSPVGDSAAETSDDLRRFTSNLLAVLEAGD